MEYDEFDHEVASTPGSAPVHVNPGIGSPLLASPPPAVRLHAAFGSHPLLSPGEPDSPYETSADPFSNLPGRAVVAPIPNGAAPVSSVSASPHADEYGADFDADEDSVPPSGLDVGHTVMLSGSFNRNGGDLSGDSSLVDLPSQLRSSDSATGSPLRVLAAPTEADGKAPGGGAGGSGAAIDVHRRPRGMAEGPGSRANTPGHTNNSGGAEKHFLADGDSANFDDYIDDFSNVDAEALPAGVDAPAALRDAIPAATVSTASPDIASSLRTQFERRFSPPAPLETPLSVIDLEVANERAGHSGPVAAAPALQTVRRAAGAAAAALAPPQSPPPRATARRVIVLPREQPVQVEVIPRNKSAGAAGSASAAVNAAKDAAARRAASANATALAEAEKKAQTMREQYVAQLAVKDRTIKGLLKKLEAATAANDATVAVSSARRAGGDPVAARIAELEAAKRERDETIRRLHEDNRGLATVARSLQRNLEVLAADAAIAPARIDGLTSELAAERERLRRAGEALQRSESAHAELLQHFERVAAALKDAQDRVAQFENDASAASSFVRLAGSSASAATRSAGSRSANPVVSPQKAAPGSGDKVLSRPAFAPAGRNPARAGGPRAGTRPRGPSSRDDLALNANRQMEARLATLEATLRLQTEALLGARPISSNDVARGDTPLLLRSPALAQQLSPQRRAALIAALGGMADGVPGDFPDRSAITLSATSRGLLTSTASPDSKSASGAAASAADVASAVTAAASSSPLLKDAWPKQAPLAGSAPVAIPGEWPSFTAPSSASAQSREYSPTSAHLSMTGVPRSPQTDQRSDVAAPVHGASTEHRGTVSSAASTNAFTSLLSSSARDGDNHNQRGGPASSDLLTTLLPQSSTAHAAAPFSPPPHAPAPAPVAESNALKNPAAAPAFASTAPAVSAKVPIRDALLDDENDDLGYFPSAVSAAPAPRVGAPVFKRPPAFAAAREDFSGKGAVPLNTPPAWEHAREYLSATVDGAWGSTGKTQRNSRISARESHSGADDLEEEKA